MLFSEILYSDPENVQSLLSVVVVGLTASCAAHVRLRIHSSHANL